MLQRKSHIHPICKKKCMSIVRLLKKKEHRGTEGLSDFLYLWWCRWSRDCHTAAQRASVGPVVVGMGPVDRAMGTAAPWAAGPQHPEHQQPFLSAWTHNAAAPGEQKRGRQHAFLIYFLYYI